MTKQASKLIFIHENDPLDKVLEKFHNELDEEAFRDQLQFIFSKQFNNYVGYYLFVGAVQPYKVFILPKIIASDLSDTEKVQQFLRYLSEFYRLEGKAEHKESAIEIAFKNLDNDTSSQNDTDTFLYHKYCYLLDSIHRFFRTHHNKNSKTISYSSQSIRHKIDLAKSIKSLDNSVVHQKKEEQFIYSMMARVVYGAVRLFINGKVALIEDTKKQSDIENKAKKLNSFLLHRFKVDRSFTIKLQSLLSISIYKNFRKTTHTKELYRTVLMLFGMERFFSGDDADVHYDTKGDYLFFRPEQLYERFVKDWLQKRDGFCGDISEQISKNYSVINESRGFLAESKPDIVIKNGASLTVVDAKWKVLNTGSAGSCPISSADILKLERDYFVHGANNATLVFCKVTNKEIIGSYTMEYSELKKFSFEVVEASIDLINKSGK